jgi:hypothetical protein
MAFQRHAKLSVEKLTLGCFTIAWKARPSKVLNSNLFTLLSLMEQAEVYTKNQRQAKFCCQADIGQASSQLHMHGRQKAGAENLHSLSLMGLRGTKNHPMQYIYIFQRLTANKLNIWHHRCMEGKAVSKVL